MSQAQEMSPAAGAVLVVEILFGLGLISWLALSLRGREMCRRRLAEWNLPPLDFACFLAFVFLGATALSAAAGYLLRPGRMGSDASMVVGGAVMHLGILLGLGGFYLMYGERVRSPGGGPPAFSVLRSGLVTFLIAMPLVFAADFAWGSVLRKLGLPDRQQDMVDILQNTQSAALKGSLVAVATLLVPITEELVFRGGLFRYFRTRVSRWVAIAFTSALFGALHVSWGDHMAGLPSLVPLFVLASVFCLAYERTGRIGTTVVAHALFNLNTFVLVVAGLGT